MNISVLGIDTAKNVFHMVGLDERGVESYRKKVSRGELLTELSQLKCGKVALEACSGSHYWGREFGKLGHSVMLLAAQHVKPYVKTNKNDWRDAAAIAEAASRGSMKRVPVKSVFQQDLQCLHRMRQQVVKERTARCNAIRGFLTEYGVVLPKGKRELDKNLLTVIERESEKLTPMIKELLLEMAADVRRMDARVAELERRLHQYSKQSEWYERLMEIDGVGPLTASAVVAAVGSADEFSNGRQMAAWLGLTPRQHSSGGKPRMSGISKRGDSYLRFLLIQGGRVDLRYAKTKDDRRSKWVTSLAARSGPHKAAVALANKTARTIWAMLAYNTRFERGHVSVPRGQ